MAMPITPFDKLMSSLESSQRSCMELVSMYWQAEVCKKLEEIEGGKKFMVNRFERDDGGGEIACVLQGGKRKVIFYFCVEDDCFVSPSVFRLKFFTLHLEDYSLENFFT